MNHSCLIGLIVSFDSWVLFFFIFFHFLFLFFFSIGRLSPRLEISATAGDKKAERTSAASLSARSRGAHATRVFGTPRETKKKTPTAKKKTNKTMTPPPTLAVVVAVLLLNAHVRGSVFLLPLLFLPVCRCWQLGSIQLFRAGFLFFFDSQTGSCRLSRNFIGWIRVL